MIYSNLLVFLTAIFLFSIDGVPETPAVSWWEALLIVATASIAYGFVARRLFKKSAARSAAGYFLAEKKLSVLALAVYAAVLFFADIKYHLFFLSMGERLPALVNVAGLAFFFVFLCQLWLAARRSYGLVFGRNYSRTTFLANNIKANLPIVLP